MNMSQIDLFDKYMETIDRLYNFKTIRKKAEDLFFNGAFTRKGGEIPVWLKARLSWIVFKEYVISADAEKRKLFFFMIGLIRSGRIAIDKGMAFLVTMLSYNRHIKDHKKHMTEFREMVIAQDQGAWKDRKIIEQ
jgi:hypothetical protein